MKIYVASSLGNYEAVLLLVAELRKLGHEITFDWAAQYQKEVKAKQNDNPSKLAKLKIAQDCLEGVRACDLLILWSEGTSRGMHIEYGMAAGLGKKLALIEPREDRMISFYELAQRYNTPLELLRALEDQQLFGINPF